jgi:hypothetical protein
MKDITTRIHRHAITMEMEERISAYRLLVRRPEGKRPLGRPRYMWEDGIKTDIREIALEGMDFVPWEVLGSNLDVKPAHQN